MKTTSRFAIAAAASLLATQAFAADLGGNCCADLEERVSELEATTARKGNRKVSLEVSGHVSQAIYYWDDGRESNVYVGQYTGTASRVRFVGNAKIDPRWSTGYLLEFGVYTAGRADRVNQLRDTGYNMIAAPFQLRHSAWWIDNKELGRIWIGQTDTATAGITVINLANTAVAGAWAKQTLNPGAGMFLRTSQNNRSGTNGAGLLAGPGMSAALTWGTLRNNAHGDPGTSDRYEVIKYVSPTLHGFIFSAAWGEDDMWDVSLKYANEWNGVRVAFGIGYGQWTDGNFNGNDLSNNGINGSGVGAGAGSVSAGALGSCANASSQTGAAGAASVADTRNRNSDVDCETFALSGAIMHVPTGLFFHGAYGQVADHKRGILNANSGHSNDSFFYLQAGIERNWFGIGKTTLYGEYHQANTGNLVNGANGCGVATGAIVCAAGGGLRAVGAADAINPFGVAAIVDSAQVNTWGLGVVQAIDAAATDLFLNFRTMEADVRLRRTDTFAIGRSNAVEDLFYVSAGAMIKF